MIALLMTLQQASLGLKLSQIEQPVVDCPMELVLGVAPRETAFLGLYIDNYSRMWDLNNKEPSNFDTPQVGSTSERVGEGLYGSTPCVVVHVEAKRNQVYVDSRKREFHIRNSAMHDWFFTKDGTLLAEVFSLTADGQTWSMDARFDADTYSVTLTSPDQGKRVMADIHPGGFALTEVTRDPWVPMFSGPKTVKLKEKKFRMLDPFSGNAVPYKMYPTDTFINEFFNVTERGQRFKILGGPSSMDVWMSQKERLLRVKREKYMFLETAS